MGAPVYDLTGSALLHYLRGERDMKTLKVRQASGHVQEVVLRGDKRDPEPLHFRVRFPGGEFEVTRTNDDGYWIHIYRNTKTRKGWGGDAVLGDFTDARADSHDQTRDLGPDIVKAAGKGLYHLAVRIDPKRVDPLFGPQEGVARRKALMAKVGK